MAALFACFTATIKTPWFDELFYADPAIGYALGEGFKSSDWSVWGSSEFWGLSNPGTGVLLACWLKLFGVGVVQAHLFFVLIFFSGLALLTRWLCRQLNLEQGWFPLLMAVGLSAHSLSGNAMHHARHDAFWPFLAWMHVWSIFQGGATVIRCATAFLLGIISTLLGLHFVAFFALSCAVLFFIEPSYVRFRLCLLHGLGFAAGGIMLFVFYYGLGVWDDFVSHRSASMGVPFDPKFWIISPDLFVLLPAFLAFPLLVGRQQESIALRSRMFAYAPLCVAMFVPVIMHFAGRYQAPYAWMTVAPALMTMLVVSAGDGARERFVRSIFVLLIAAGLAYRSSDLLRAFADREARRELIVLLERHIPKHAEPGFASIPVLYDIRGSGRRCFASFVNPGVKVRHEVLASLKWAVLSEADLDIIRPQLLGEWDIVVRVAPGSPSPGHGGYVLLRRNL